MDILNLITTRRSVREFAEQAVSQEQIQIILQAAQWAPSGLNNQPWRFMVLSGDDKNAMAQYTHYSHIIKGADKIILVFLDQQASYHYEKDIMAIGAAIENMLLAIHGLGLGACWLGEILKQREQIHKHLNLSKDLELQAAIALGYPKRSNQKSSRKPIEEIIITPNN